MDEIIVIIEENLIQATIVENTIVVEFPGTQGVPGVSANALSEEPSGVINGINTYFTISNTPVNESEKVYLNGLRLKRTEDYTITSNVISITTPPISGDIITVDYNI